MIFPKDKSRECEEFAGLEPFGTLVLNLEGGGHVPLDKFAAVHRSAPNAPARHPFRRG